MFLDLWLWFYWVACLTTLINFQWGVNVWFKDIQKKPEDCIFGSQYKYSTTVLSLTLQIRNWFKKLAKTNCTPSPSTQISTVTFSQKIYSIAKRSVDISLQTGSAGSEENNLCIRKGIRDYIGCYYINWQIYTNVYKNNHSRKQQELAFGWNFFPVRSGHLNWQTTKH